ncbi:MAG TPA: hypothetical protein VHY34_01515 [Caulobacteraceae bacterium]|jgi:hypothetical protein|nr:hypothetical protein [Caulobacteraceae bacterium]
MITRRILAAGFAVGAAGVTLGLGAANIVRAQEDDWDDPKAWPNVFISPFGQPFRAKDTAPYPVVDWFKQVDKNSDSKVDKTEFLADAAFFFDALDVNKDGVLSPMEVRRYERGIAPEILGYRVKIADGARVPGLHGGRLWRTQGGPAGQGVMGALPPDAAPDPNDTRKIPHSLDESRNGASPFSFFDQPEPVTAADLDFNGIIRKKNFLKLAGVHFQTLDHKDQGYLTLAALPRTHVQEVLERYQKHR